jgi:hypothetical protein
MEALRLEEERGEAAGEQVVASVQTDEDEVIEFGRGLSNYNSVEIDRVKGHRRCAHSFFPLLQLSCAKEKGSRSLTRLRNIQFRH